MVSGLGVARAAGRPGLLAPGRSEFCMPSCNTRMGLACEEAMSGRHELSEHLGAHVARRRNEVGAGAVVCEERWLWLGAFMAQAAG